MVGTLLLRLAGPMQSWGTASRFDERDSQLEPSKSGVIGLLCAALGRDRHEPVDDLARLRMGVRVDREGHLMRDYQTIMGFLDADGEYEPDRTIVSHRYYLSDAVFLVGLEGDDMALLRRIHDALRAPRWPLYLGRKSFVPSPPVWLHDGVQPQELQTTLVSYPPLVPVSGDEFVARLLLEHSYWGAVRMDQPIAPFAEHRFGPRYVISEIIHVRVSDQTRSGPAPSSSAA